MSEILNLQPVKTISVTATAANTSLKGTAPFDVGDFEYIRIHNTSASYPVYFSLLWDKDREGGTTTATQFQYIAPASSQTFVNRAVNGICAVCAAGQTATLVVESGYLGAS